MKLGMVSLNLVAKNTRPMPTGVKGENSYITFIDYEITCRCCGYKEMRTKPNCQPAYEITIGLTGARGLFGIEEFVAQHLSSKESKCFQYLVSLGDDDLTNHYLTKFAEEETRSQKQERERRDLTQKEKQQNNNKLMRECDVKNQFIRYFLNHAISYSSPKAFPSIAGIYLVVAMFKGHPLYLYVGRSQNLRQRWTNHHRYKEIMFLKNTLDVELEFLVLHETKYIDLNKVDLIRIEAEAIYNFQPRLNGNKVMDNSKV